MYATELPDGTYLTRVRYAPDTSTPRTIIVKNNWVRLANPESKFTFTVSDFFKVNILLNPLEGTNHEN